eukprot:s3861_g3.t1
MVLAIAAAGPSGIFCRGPMKGLGMPGTGARIKRKPLRCQWKVASLPFLVRKATPAKVRADAQVARAAQVAHAAQEARLDRAAQEARLDRAAQEARLDRVAQEARLDRAAREARLARVAQAARAAHGPMKGSGPGKGATFSPENRSEPFFLHPKELRTPLGVSFARCIKPGVDTAGHSFFKMLGASAGDEHCYDLFVRLFDPMIARRQQQPPNLALAAPVEAANVVSVQVSLERNLSTLRFTPAMSLEERWKVEEILCSALAELPEDFAGEYFRLRGNHQSSGSRLPELTEAQEAELSVEKWLFEAPDAPWILSTGRARHWPKARGVFLSKSKEVAAWINDENHLRLIVRRSGFAADLKAAVELLCRAEEALSSSLAKHGYHFARSERLGFLTTCPSDLGAAFRAKLRSALPLLGSEIGFSKVTRALGVQAKRVLHSEGHWDVSLSSSLVLDPSESCTAQVNLLLFAIHQLSDMERRLSSGEQLDLVAEAERLAR